MKTSKDDSKENTETNAAVANADKILQNKYCAITHISLSSSVISILSILNIIFIDNKTLAGKKMRILSVLF